MSPADSETASTQQKPGNMETISGSFHPGGLLGHQSFIELNSRERCRALLDTGTFRELLGPFERLVSPWLAMQGVVPQSDDGLIVARGRIKAKDSVIAAVEGRFQGGGIGEVSGAKIVAALDLALRDVKNGRPIQVVLLLESGGVRLQEANLGLEAIAEINSSLIALRRHVPVIGIIAGMVGCFGGMSITASLCSYLIMTRQARLGLNGPEVIEEQSGVEEFDSRDRHLIWTVTGGEQRYLTDFADYLVQDDVAAIKECVVDAFDRGIPRLHRSEKIDYYLERLAAVDVSHQLESSEARNLLSRSEQ